jgi:hypothetical protein
MIVSIGRTEGMSVAITDATNIQLGIAPVQAAILAIAVPALLGLSLPFTGEERER